MRLHLVSEPGGEILDTITISGKKPIYATGAARDVVRSLALRLGSKKRAVKAMSEGGWSNGYVTIKPE